MNERVPEPGMEDDAVERVQELTVGGISDDDLPEPPLALYRRYRPETFDEVIGEDHVLSLIHISEPTRHFKRSRMPSSA